MPKSRLGRGIGSALLKLQAQGSNHVDDAANTIRDRRLVYLQLCVIVQLDQEIFKELNHHFAARGQLTAQDVKVISGEVSGYMLENSN